MSTAESSDDERVRRFGVGWHDSEGTKGQALPESDWICLEVFGGYPLSTTLISSAVSP